MIEMPEATTIASQMQTTLVDKTIVRFARGSMTHKFLWLNRPDEEYQTILADKTITGASSYGRSIYLHLGKDYMLWWGDTGGKILYHARGEELPKKCHLVWDFSDGSHLTFSMQMWGSVKLLDSSQFGDRPKGEKGIQPLSREFTLECFDHMLDEYPEKTAKGIKGFLVATGYVTTNSINGLGNAYVQDILFQAGIDPRHKIPDLGVDARRSLYEAIRTIIIRAIELGGRYDEVDLFGQPGRYIRLMDSKAVGTPCPTCRGEIQKIQYLGGACYLCSHCQV